MPTDTEHLGGQIPDLIGQCLLTNAGADHAGALDLGEQLLGLILGVEEHLGTEILVRYPLLKCYDRNGALMSLVNPRAVPPYPPQRYTKDDPEISAWLRRGTDPPDYDTFGLVQYHYLANEKPTGGDYGLYRVDIGPKGGGPGPHFHRAISEAFFVLSGTSSYTTATAGSTGIRTITCMSRPAACTVSETRPTQRRRS